MSSDGSSGLQTGMLEIGLRLQFAGRIVRGSTGLLFACTRLTVVNDNLFVFWVELMTLVPSNPNSQRCFLVAGTVANPFEYDSCPTRSPRGSVSASNTPQIPVVMPGETENIRDWPQSKIYPHSLQQLHKFQYQIDFDAGRGIHAPTNNATGLLKYRSLRLVFASP